MKNTIYGINAIFWFLIGNYISINLICCDFGIKNSCFKHKKFDGIIYDKTFNYNITTTTTKNNQLISYYTFSAVGIHNNTCSLKTHQNKYNNGDKIIWLQNNYNKRCEYKYHVRDIDIFLHIMLLIYVNPIALFIFAMLLMLLIYFVSILNTLIRKIIYFIKKCASYNYMLLNNNINNNDIQLEIV